MEVPAEAVLDSGGDFVDQTRDVVGEGAVDDDDVRVEGVENRVQADSDVVGEILHYFAGVGAAFLVILEMYCSRQPWLPQGQGRPSGKRMVWPNSPA